MGYRRHQLKEEGRKKKEEAMNKKIMGQTEQKETTEKIHLTFTSRHRQGSPKEPLRPCPRRMTPTSAIRPIQLRRTAVMELERVVSPALKTFQSRAVSWEGDPSMAVFRAARRSNLAFMRSNLAVTLLTAVSWATRLSLMSCSPARGTIIYIEEEEGEERTSSHHRQVLVYFPPKFEARNFGE